MNAGADTDILKKLEEWEKQEGSLSRLLEFYKNLLSIQLKVRTEISTPEQRLSKSSVRERLLSGEPIMEFADLAIDWRLFQNAFERVITLFRSYSEVFGEIPASLKGTVPSSNLLQQSARSWFDRDELPIELITDDADKIIIAAIIHATIKPFLVNHKDVLIGFVEQERWRRGYCPICGGNPDMAYLEKEVGARWLICNRCDAEWLFQRLECPYCGNLDQKTLAYFTDEKELYRLYVCEKCRHYLKAIDLRKSEGEILLPLERYLTLDLDSQACKEGYTPGTSPRHQETVNSSPASR